MNDTKSRFCAPKYRRPLAELVSWMGTCRKQLPRLCAAKNEGIEMKSENPSGFTDALKDACRKLCAEFGDPPCWRLPELVEPCELITPCDECKEATK